MDHRRVVKVILQKVLIKIPGIVNLRINQNHDRVQNRLNDQDHVLLKEHNHQKDLDHRKELLVDQIHDQEKITHNVFVQIQEKLNVVDLVEIVIQDQEIETLDQDVEILDHVINIDHVLEIDIQDLEIDFLDQEIDVQDRKIEDHDQRIVKRLIIRGGIQTGHLDQ